MLGSPNSSILRSFSSSKRFNSISLSILGNCSNRVSSEIIPCNLSTVSYTDAKSATVFLLKEIRIEEKSKLAFLIDK